MREQQREGPQTGWLHRAASLYRDVVLISATTLGVLLVFELVAVGAIFVLDRDLPRQARLPYYRGVEWGETYWREYSDLSRVGARRYEPFSLWRFRSYDGETVNVDENGIRPTPGAQCDGDAPSLHVFGGSTTWGTGSPDWGTIPAYLLEELAARRGRPVCVVNHAQGGHVSTQEGIELLRALQDGVRPDWVIFYDGINDSVAAAESGQVGVHQGLAQLRARFEHSESPLGRLVAESHLGRLVERARLRFVRRARYRDDLDVGALGSGVVEHYLGHAELVHGLGRVYGYEAFLFWQPTLAIGRKPLSERERRIRAGVDPVLRGILESAWGAARAAASQREGLFYLGDVLDTVEEEVYVDQHHVTPSANRRIAQRMAELAWGAPPGPHRAP